MSELNILVSTVDGEPPITILHLSGHLHGETEGPLLEQVRQLHQSGCRYLLLDLSGVEILTSAGLRAIHAIFNLLTPKVDASAIHHQKDEPYKSPYLKLLCPNPNIYYVLNIAGFLQNIPIFSDRDEAIQSFS